MDSKEAFLCNWAGDLRLSMQLTGKESTANWFYRNLMALSVKQCHYIHFGNSS